MANNGAEASMETSRLDPGSAEGNGRATPPPPREAWRLFRGEIREARAYLAYQLQVRADALRARAIRIGVIAVLGLAGFLVFVSVLVLGLGLLLTGLARGLGEALNPWLGNVIVGGGLVLILVGGTAGGLWALGRARLRAAMERCQRRLERQREELGTDVHQRAGTGHEASK